MRPERLTPLRLAGLYGLFGIVWTLSSDYLLAATVSDPALSARLQTLKGLAFVLLGGLLIFHVSRRSRQAQQQLLGALTHNARLWQQAQRNAALGSWEYREGFHWSPEALHLLGRDAGNASSTLEQLLSWLHPRSARRYSVPARPCSPSTRPWRSAHACTSHTGTRPPG
ncbi:hypothetical protein I0D68_12975 [Pseudomonas lalucatii]|nr:hypothetical protein [Pseudomonas lalucatii]QVM86683.1 hypothetical protein I0D68_12975 [Pseudomonas lalucatii]